MLVEEDEPKKEAKCLVWSDGNKCLRESEAGKEEKQHGLREWVSSLVARDGLVEKASSE